MRCCASNRESCANVIRAGGVDPIGHCSSSAVVWLSTRVAIEVVTLSRCSNQESDRVEYTHPLVFALPRFFRRRKERF